MGQEDWHLAVGKIITAKMQPSWLCQTVLGCEFDELLPMPIVSDNTIESQTDLEQPLE